MKQGAFRTFYEKHFDRVYRFVLFRVRMNEAVAEDLTSEIFLKALKNFETYEPSISEFAWIMTIARNHLFNHYRDQKETVDVDAMAWRLEGTDGRKDTERADEVLMLSRALHTLAPKDRRLIEMKHLEGYRYKDMAGELGKTVGSIRVETHRAMQKLKQALEKHL
ncbi:MAG: RNA polymerase sigma factor [Parcubacteria group bacterium GW2011_GWA2_56_7]|nr:MAG: RNA polymerase sigma factor [Parcubacteria group bacterium GW2011_GWA2_56_7]